ncbi:hypothetical protein D3C72_2548350 [compost metagenome]
MLHAMAFRNLIHLVEKRIQHLLLRRIHMLYRHPCQIIELQHNNMQRPQQQI